MAVVEQDLVVRHVGDDAAPWVDTGIGIDLKVMRVDLDRGTWVIRNRFQPGVQIPRHRHTGPVDGYTLTGRWHYLEYDFMNTAGSYIHEPAGSVHTLNVPEDNTEPTDVLFVIEGALLNLTPDGQIESVTDAPSILEAYFALLDAAGMSRPTGLIVD
jgi:2,4'-dihydroxyacetophenone dioxygenase